MKILGFQKTTLLDYPQHIASIIFTGGCNFACPYCHNSELIHPFKDTPTIPEEEVLMHLGKQKGKIEGLVISGGEPTLQQDLLEFCKKIKALGMLIKLDTNGTNHELLSQLIDEKLVDYIAMDAKQPAALLHKVLPQNTPEAVITKHTDSYKKCIELLKNASNDVDYEIRTTVVSDLFDSDLAETMASELSGVKRLYLQPFVDSDSVLLPGLHAPDEDEMKLYQSIFKRHIEAVEIRGMDI